MEHGHETIEHLRRNSVVYVGILLVVHLIRSTTRVATSKYFLNESFNLLLVTQSILITNILTLYVII